MKISKGNVRNINKKILAGTIAFTFLTTKIIGYKVVKDIKYSHIKQGYAQTENVDITIPKDYAIIPKKDELNFNNFVSEFNTKDNYRKNVKQLIARGKRKLFKK